MPRLRKPQPFTEAAPVTPAYLVTLAWWLLASLPNAWRAEGTTVTQDPETGSVTYALQGLVSAVPRSSQLVVYLDPRPGTLSGPLVRVEWTVEGDSGHYLRLQEHLGWGQKPERLRYRLRKHAVWVEPSA